MKATRILMAAAVAAVMATPAMANGPAAAPMHHMHHQGDWFAMMDTNHDGVISKDEWMADAAKKFDHLDANHDGKISKKEWAGMHDRMMDHHHHEMAHEDWSEPTVANHNGSTSMPPANNQETPTTRKPGGADGAGGWTAQ